MESWMIPDVLADYAGEEFKHPDLKKSGNPISNPHIHYSKMTLGKIELFFSSLVAIMKIV